MTTHYWERKQTIDHLFSIIGKVQSDETVDDEIKSCLAKYLCVVVSGFLETAIQDIYHAYAQDKSHANVTSYVSKKLLLFRSPKMGNILGLTSCFSTDWGKALDTYCQDEIEGAVNSLVDNRHKIGHGKDVGITYSRVKAYYESSVKLLKRIEQQCDT